jgi:hypothetical protein
MDRKEYFKIINEYIDKLTDEELNDLIERMTTAKEEKLKNKGCQFVFEFIDKVKDKYPNIKINYEFNNSEHIITHNYKNKLNDNEFEKYTGVLLSDIMYLNNIYNISFYYDC